LLLLLLQTGLFLHLLQFVSVSNKLHRAPRCSSMHTRAAAALPPRSSDVSIRGSSENGKHSKAAAAAKRC
jgi:hypothetical protein